MRPVTAFGDDEWWKGSTAPSPEEALGQLVAGSHVMASWCDVLFDRQIVAEKIPLVSGSVTMDRTAATLASCRVTISDPDLVPVAPADVLAPYGAELQLWRGVRVGDSEAACSLGVFPIQRSSVGGITLTTDLSGLDRSKQVSDAIFEDDYQVAAGTNFATAIAAMIADGVDDLTFNLATTSFVTPVLTFSETTDRWAAAQAMARAIGHELFFDGLGVCTMRPEPTFGDTPVGTVAESANMTDITLDLDRGPAYNKVIAVSSNGSVGDVYKAAAYDSDPQSPTYYSGPFGRKAKRYTSSYITSDAQAAAAAVAELAANLGVAKSISASMLTDPRLETSDVIQVVRSALEVDELHIIDRLDIGLGASDVMTASVRAQVGTITGV